MNHLGLAVRDLKRSEEAFYAPVLTFLGYAKIVEEEGMTVWWCDGARGAINLWQASPELKERTHERYAPGFHHFAFWADDREDVDRLHDVLVERGIRVLDAPAEYPQYMPGYYAVFFADPDGLKFEFVHIPSLD
jgi:glyoxylase I family protein